MRDVLIAGVGMTPFGKFPQSSLRALAERATADAISDAGASPCDVEMAFVGNAVGGLITGQEMIRAQVALRDSGLLGIPMMSVENACASSSTATHLAWQAVASGAVEVALAVGVEKLTHPDKARAFEAIGTAIDLETRDELERQVNADEPATEAGRSLFMDIYARLAREYSQASGATIEDFARVAVKSHRHGALNPKAQYRQGATVDDVLNSRLISRPLTLLMCSPLGDGAAVLLLCSDRFARRHGSDTVRILASTLVSGKASPTEHAVTRAANRAYQIAGLGPQDIDVAEVHDATASAELALYEELGFAPAGEGPRLIRTGATELGGKLPVNVSGGLISRGHPIGATGCAQLVELTEQLRGRAVGRQVEGGRIALAQNAGGFLGSEPAAVAIHILGT
jgi:acetyl-CoA acetyltransferase